MIYSYNKMRLLSEVTERLMTSGKVKRRELASEIARKWVNR